MLDPATRCFFHHREDLFDSALVANVLGHLQAVEAASVTTRLDAREARAVRLGGLTDSVRFDPCWYNLWRSRREALIEAFSPFLWVVFPAFIRHLTRSDQLVPWHQDAGYQRLLGPRAHRRVITCFVPLDADPAACSTLEFAAGEHTLLDHATNGDHGAVIEKPDFPERIHFDLRSGDALVFGDHTPHRTIVPDRGTIDRYSFEFRLVVPEDAVEGKDYFDVEGGSFVRTDGSRREHP